jgi:uncharacterized repeat protein (TIGR03837 family)
MRWDLFCHVIDNLGDAGVCWRLASDLAARGEAVTLVIDDPGPLRFMAPGGAPGVEVLRWSEVAQRRPPPDVVIEAFGCNPPRAYIEDLAALPSRPCWINLEYLSAEGFVERAHGLPSPQSFADARPWVKHFFYPGFSERTGGLLREPGLLQRRAAFGRDEWLRGRGWPRSAEEQVVVLFSYANAAIPALVDRLRLEPTLLLVPQGPAQNSVRGQLGAALTRGALRAVALPWISQVEFDALLWSADLNFVRGEDSLVRALWAGAPFVWQLYPQADDVHHRKLRAFLDAWLRDPPDAMSASIRRLFEAWNAGNSAPVSPLQWPALDSWRGRVQAWRGRLAGQDDLTSQLVRFAARKG